MKWNIYLICLLCLSSCKDFKNKKSKQVTLVTYIEETPSLDGRPIENFWNRLDWQPIDQNWIGGPFDHADFNGKYKIAWNEEGLYLLLEIVDDSLYKKSNDPLKFWWNDDCVVVYIDEDNSGGPHQFNHNAFTYHVAIDGNVADLGEDNKPNLYNDHIISAHETEDTTTHWELQIKVFPDTYHDGSNVKPVVLKENKRIGFALAYADNDQSSERENLIGSVFIPGEDKNQGWINANVFGTLKLVE
ncbi:sugar-binding protein [uncultured Maribacter sp.]|uniref:sugar-binding protein n=1 Tax=uncultured Maribacter sp. TaxID=431308 RepID=UPI0030ED1AEA|tara:strand:+ start:4536 stop:5270 length:735 start_codon:yes stop_codon:yes gene_type:complete